MTSYLDAHHPIIKKAYLAILVKTDRTRPQLVLSNLASQVVFESGAIIDRKGVIRHDSDLGSRVLVAQDFSGGDASDTIPNNQKGLTLRHGIPPYIC